MSPRPHGPSLLGKLAGRSTLLLAPLVLVVLLLAAIPSPPSEERRGDPRQAARSIQESLQERIRAWMPGLAILDDVPLDSAAVETLTRDLFARARGEIAPSPSLPLPAPGAPREAPVEAYESPVAETRPAPPAEPRLTGVLIDGPWRQAVIDGQIVREGDTVQGYRVSEITTRSVRLDAKSGALTLTLGGGS